MMRPAGASRRSDVCLAKSMKEQNSHAGSFTRALIWIALIGGFAFVILLITFPPRTCPPGPPPPLVKAVLANDLRKVQRLLEQGADPDRGRAPFGHPSPLDAALEKGNQEMIHVLRSSGAVSRVEIRQTNQLRLQEGLPPLVITTRTGRVYR